MPRTPTFAMLGAIALAARFAVAADLPDDQMAAKQFSGVINANNVYVRSYAGEPEYPVARLNRGDTVVVVGNKDDWLKVLPPTGVKCLVGKAWVTARTNGFARVTDQPASVPNVRIASLLNSNYGRVVVTLKPGQDVKVIGQQDDWFEIEPPPGAFAYVHKRFVDPVKEVEVIVDRGTMRVKGNGEERPTNKPSAGTPVPPLTPEMVENAKKPPVVAQTPTTTPADTTAIAEGAVAEGAVAEGPTTTPAAVAESPSMAALEAKLLAAGKLPLAQQPIKELLAGYRGLAADASQPELTRTNAGLRVKLLEVRQDALKTLAAVEADRQKRAAEQLPLAAEAKEIGDRMTAAEFKTYAAVGTVRASSLAANGRTLYRLTDPATGRTVIYVDNADGKAASLEGQFVGVKGVVTEDAVRQIKLVRPQTLETVDPGELKSGAVRSGLIPASMTATADAGR